MSYVMFEDEEGVLICGYVIFQCHRTAGESGNKEVKIVFRHETINRRQMIHMY